MNDHMEQIIEIGARALHDVDPENSGETFENCCARAWEMRDARAVITAVLPHIRAMIADEIREEWLIHSMACGESPATTPEQTDRDRGISLGLERAAQIAERKQP